MPNLNNLQMKRWEYFFCTFKIFSFFIQFIFFTKKQSLSQMSCNFLLNTMLLRYFSFSGYDWFWGNQICIFSGNLFKIQKIWKSIEYMTFLHRNTINQYCNCNISTQIPFAAFNITFFIIYTIGLAMILDMILWIYAIHQPFILHIWLPIQKFVLYSNKIMRMNFNLSSFTKNIRYEIFFFNKLRSSYMHIG